jgi:hypothetical protein
LLAFEAIWARAAEHAHLVAISARDMLGEPAQRGGAWAGLIWPTNTTQKPRPGTISKISTNKSFVHHAGGNPARNIDYGWFNSPGDARGPPADAHHREFAGPSKCLIMLPGAIRRPRSNR